jgi:methylthioribose-1-phosphate isomerase
VLIAPEDAKVSNFGFDVTPRHLVTGLITERGVAAANEKDLGRLFPEHVAAAIAR